MCGEPIPEGRMICPACENMEPSFDTTKIYVLIDKFADVAKFVALVSKCVDDVVAVSQNYRVNAKSLLGIYSLDLSKPIRVEFYGVVPYEIRDELKKYMVKE